MSSIPISAAGVAADPNWRWRHLLRAPHRLAFAAAMLVLMLTSAWWAMTLSARLGWVSHWPLVVSPTLAHGTMMTFGFLPLFFMGFLNTAGPRWLGVKEPGAHDILWPVGLQLVGWTLWVVGSLTAVYVMMAGGVVALAGLGLSYQQLSKLVSRSKANDRTHGKSVMVAGWVGVASLALLLVAIGSDEYGLARAALLTGLWGFIAATFVTVAHRMIPFFTASAVPMVTVWRPYWVLYLLLAALATNLMPVWAQTMGLDSAVLEVSVNFWLLVSGLIVIWLSIVWGLLKAVSNRLLMMLHIGFAWLGLSFLLASVGHFWSWTTGTPDWSLGALHATTMGFVGSLTVAMITRVSCGHSGRPLRADGLMWALFLGLQVIVLLRIAGDLTQTIWSLRLLWAASIGWTLIFVVWGVRLLTWYGKPRKDNQPG